VPLCDRAALLVAKPLETRVSGGRTAGQWEGVSFGFLGIQFGWGLQMANMSAIYEYLGARADQIPILWLAAPLTGMLIQPIIGNPSDRTLIFHICQKLRGGLMKCFATGVRTAQFAMCSWRGKHSRLSAEGAIIHAKRQGRLPG
jgi:hypothetical protein